MVHATRMRDRRRRIAVDLPLPENTRILPVQEPDLSWTLHLIGTKPPDEIHYQPGNSPSPAIYTPLAQVYSPNQEYPNTEFLPTFLPDHHILVAPIEFTVTPNRNIIAHRKTPDGTAWETVTVIPDQITFSDENAPYTVWKASLCQQE